jgi:hypothetical protein
MRYGAAMRAYLLGLLIAAAPLACDSPKGGGDDAPSAAAAKSPVEVVVRKVTLQKTVRRPAAGGEEGESWTALDGQVYAVVTTDILHNQCAEGDEVSMRQASLLLDGKPVEAAGGGGDLSTLCLLCEAKKSAECSGGTAPMRPFVFIFSVPKDADVSKAVLRYREKDAPLSVAEVSDLRADEKTEAKVKELREKIVVLRKKLENTSSIPAGKLIEDEIHELEAQIKKLEGGLEGSAQ